MNLTCHRYHDTPLRLRGSIANFRRLTVDVHRNDSDGNFGICRSSYRFDAVLRMGLSGTTHQIPTPIAPALSSAPCWVDCRVIFMALEVLGQLPASELLAAVGQLGLSVGDPSSRDQLIATLATSPYDSLTAVFSGYKRERLKELCRALGLDDSGKEKADLILAFLTASPSQQQLGLGLSAASSPAQEAKPKRGRPAGTQKKHQKRLILPSHHPTNWPSKCTRRRLRES